MPATPEMIADPDLGSCHAGRDGCEELGPWRPFYQTYVCEVCLQLDQQDILNSVRPEWWPEVRLRSLLWFRTFRGSDAVRVSYQGFTIRLGW